MNSNSLPFITANARRTCVFRLPFSLLKLGLCLLPLLIACCCPVAMAQRYGTPDRGEPGDSMIQDYLRKEAEKIHATFPQDLRSLAQWKGKREQYREELLYMLGVSPMPPRTKLKATVTGTWQGDGYVVEKLHYQSSPGLYVTANLYRPTNIPSGKRLPAIVYVCGHSHRGGRNGVKTQYQSHGIWFAKHGYLCLTLDTLQLGEIASVHHGTYREERWWWHSRGYTPAGVECWNGMRGIDYLVSRPDVDPKRIGMTGRSGGGAVSFWVATVDERVAAVVPVSGMADLPSYVGNFVVNGHCDCMFMNNTYRWPWARMASMVAPRPLLFSNGDQDAIFPMDANERIINRLERTYSLYGAGDRVDSLVSIGGHSHRPDMRQGEYRFFNSFLKNDARYVTDSEDDLVSGPRDNPVFPIPPSELRVFPEDSDLPKDELNTTIDQHFVPLAKVAVPTVGDFPKWKQGLLDQLRQVTFRTFPEKLPAARLLKQPSPREIHLETEPGIRVRLRIVSGSIETESPGRIFLVVFNDSPESRGSNAEPAQVPAWLKERLQEGDVVALCEPRGVGWTRWTRRNPPNYVERSHVLVGQTVDTGRVRDIAAAASYLRQKLSENEESQSQITLVGEGSAAVLAAYAALLEPGIESLLLAHLPTTHMASGAPQLLNVLRVCDVPDVLGMLAPRKLTLRTNGKHDLEKVSAIYHAAGAGKAFSLIQE